jgi:DNA polymerase III epsilon subunit-like protein
MQNHLIKDFHALAKDNKLAFVNFQTTGLDATDSQIFEVAVLIWNPLESKLTGYSEYINIGESINYYMGEILKVDVNLIRKAKQRDDVMRDFFQKVDGCLICAYNSDFVRAFMRVESIRLKIYFDNDFFCIRNFVENKIQNIPSLKLDDVARALGVQIESNNNRASSKAEKAFRVYLSASNFNVAQDTLQEHEDCSYYTYVHLDKDENCFYVGVGHDDIAWSKDRHRLWHRYVNNHLNGLFNVKIIKNNISSKAAFEIKQHLLKTHSNKLVNVVNPFRDTDFKEIERLSFLSDENNKLFNHAIELESSDINAASQIIMKCIKNLDSYSFIKSEHGLLGTLIDEERSEIGYKGNLKYLDKLSLILKRMGRINEAREISEEYFSKFKLDASLKSSIKIKKRVGLI